MKWADIGNLSRPGRIAAGVVMFLCGVASIIWTYKATHQSAPVQLQIAAHPGLPEAHINEQKAVEPRVAVFGQNGRLDLNKASQAELELLPGVGPALSKRIIDYRTAYGPFEKFEDLDKVQGIGPRMLEKIRPLAEVRPPKPE